MAVVERRCCGSLALFPESIFSLAQCHACRRIQPEQYRQHWSSWLYSWLTTLLQCPLLLGTGLPEDVCDLRILSRRDRKDCFFICGGCVHRIDR
ncbi:hypothetical protein AAFF_G00424320 [Aldrovandia affinis]|uniref:Uncharacterized protein n=1 Tax=Aldrovandia affinis TaxID=143900 RepID=A0AAD7WZZ7_9TELE|nr:hypothetical protein AAFF_G00424320 [Aldrovandia affinis]